jgi:hypothetical protein
MQRLVIAETFQICASTRSVLNTTVHSDLGAMLRILGLISEPGQDTWSRSGAAVLQLR